MTWDDTKNPRVIIDFEAPHTKEKFRRLGTELLTFLRDNLDNPVEPVALLALMQRLIADQWDVKINEFIPSKLGSVQ
jgi:hypothetical protein